MQHHRPLFIRCRPGRRILPRNRHNNVTTRTPEGDWVLVLGPVQQQPGYYIYESPVEDSGIRFFQLRLL
jgi:hypothetical protein